MNKHTENYHLLHYVAPQSGLQGNFFTLAKLAKVIFALEGSLLLVLQWNLSIMDTRGTKSELSGEATTLPRQTYIIIFVL